MVKLPGGDASGVLHDLWFTAESSPRLSCLANSRQSRVWAVHSDTAGPVSAIAPATSGTYQRLPAHSYPQLGSTATAWKLALAGSRKASTSAGVPRQAAG